MSINELLNIPLKARHKEKIAINTFINESNLTNYESKAIEKNISTIYLVSVLSRNTVGIPAYITDEYKYEVIYIFEVSLKKTNELSKINEMVQKAFPNPSIIYYKFKDVYYVSLASKRRNRADSQKSVIEEIIISDQLSESNKFRFIIFEELPSENLKVLYDRLIYFLYSSKFITYFGDIPKNKNINLKDYAKKLIFLNSRLESLNSQYRAENMMASKMKKHIEIKKIESEINDIKSILQEEN